MYLFHHQKGSVLRSSNLHWADVEGGRAGEKKAAHVAAGLGIHLVNGHDHVISYLYFAQGRRTCVIISFFVRHQ